MDFSRVGRKIQELRKYRGYTQKELAKDICTQAQISKIEKGTIVPYASTMFYIAERLGANMYYFFEEALTERSDYVRSVFSMLETYRFEHDYASMRELLSKEQNNPIFKIGYYEQYMLWHEAICAYEIDNDPTRALELASAALDAYHKGIYTERKGEITNAMAIIYNLEHEYKKAADICRKALQDHQDLMNPENKSIELKLIYTLTKALTYQGAYQQSIDWCTRGIDRCIDLQNSYVFGELLYQRGQNLLVLGFDDSALQDWGQACSMFDTMKQIGLADHIRQEINDYKKDGIIHLHTLQ
ncbi:hypothetical protein CHL76_13135 [Marinococcus halophilus]|nr:helix-turn-helix domain-containing protein [Marinococcus halophilus]OZT79353.1 hypothetical protein CHL76_13135 [Marinococcus halophilus]